MDLWKRNNMDVSGTKANMKKSKLVTITCTPSSNDEFDFSTPPFQFRGQSRSEKSEINVSLPAYPGNIVYYEHYVSLISPCTRLSFVYTGGDQNGVVHHDFYDYKQVHTVDFSDGIMSVKAMFQIISQLQNCSEVRIFLNETNIGLTNTDCRFPARLVQEYLTHFRNASVKTLKITGSTAHGRSDCNQTRFHDILTYANTCFPKLEAVRICMENSGGNYWDKVQEFCSNKLNLPKHSVSLKNGKVTCDPDMSLVAASSSARAMNAQKSVPRAIAESPVSAQSVTSQITQLIKIKEEKIAPVSIKKEKDDVPLVDLIDSDEEPCSPAKKQRLQEDSPNSRSSTNSRASTVVIAVSPNKLHNLGIGKGSSYDDWEDGSSYDEAETTSSSPKVLPTPTATPPLLQVDAPLSPPPIPPSLLLPLLSRPPEPTAVYSASTQKPFSSLAQIKIDPTRIDMAKIQIADPIQLRNILNTATANSGTVGPGPSNQLPTQIHKYKRGLKEGVDFERRPKPGNSEQKRRNITQTST